MDDSLLAQARAGSAEAFAALYRELAGPVAGYLRAKGAPDADELTSEVFLAVFRGLATFESDVAGFRSWVFTIAHRRAVDSWRAAGRTVAVAPYQPEADRRVAASAEVEALDLIGAEQADALLAQLSPDQREVIALRVLADLSLAEVAAVVGKPVGAVKALQRRGLASLRRIMAAQGVSR